MYTELLVISFPQDVYRTTGNITHQDIYIVDYTKQVPSIQNMLENDNR
jgi:hypothetical protein